MEGTFQQKARKPDGHLFCKLPCNTHVGQITPGIPRAPSSIRRIMCELGHCGKYLGIETNNSHSNTVVSWNFT